MHRIYQRANTKCWLFYYYKGDVTFENWMTRLKNGTTLATLVGAILLQNK